MCWLRVPFGFQKWIRDMEQMLKLTSILQSFWRVREEFRNGRVVYDLEI